MDDEVEQATIEVSGEEARASIAVEFTTEGEHVVELHLNDEAGAEGSCALFVRTGDWPELVHVVPVDGAVYSTAQDIGLLVEVDPGDTDPVDLALDWSLDGDELPGELGSDGRIELALPAGTLGEGGHELSVRVETSEGYALETASTFSVESDCTPQSHFPDADLDGHGATEGPEVRACSMPEDWSTVGDDCDDTDERVHSGAAESYGDERDEDCDGEEDEDCVVVVPEHEDTIAVLATLYESLEPDVGYEFRQPGDLDGDGAEDFAVGETGGSYFPKRITVVTGWTGGTEELPVVGRHMVQSDTKNTYGFALSIGTVDLDGDGRLDVLTSARPHDWGYLDLYGVTATDLGL